MRRFLLVATLIVAVALAQRPKVKDQRGHTLIEMEDVGESCVDSYTGYAIVNGSLEKCDNLTSLQLEGVDQARAYEKFKCKHLRVNGEMKDGKCVCKDKYNGPICNEYDGCPASRPSLYQSVCTRNGCANDGIMAIGTSHMECVCKGEWDGRHCDRLTCWRLTNRGHDMRYRNVQATKTCECGPHYEGPNCATLKSCEKTGVFGNGVCTCEEGYGGETCGQKCPVGQKTCYQLLPSSSSSNNFSLFLALLVLAAVFNRFI